MALSNVLEQVNLTYMQNISAQNENTHSFSNAPGTFSRIGHVLGHGTSQQVSIKLRRLTLYQTSFIQAQWYEIRNRWQE